MRPVVNTEKHIVQETFSTTAVGVIDPISVLNTVAVPTSSALEVREGAKVSAIYCEFWLTTDDATQGSFVVTIEKKPAGVANMTAAQSANLNAYPNKKNIFFTKMGLVGNSTQMPVNVIAGWIKIPKGKQRFSLGDSIRFNLLAQSNGTNHCGFFIFKEQY